MSSENLVSRDFWRGCFLGNGIPKHIWHIDGIHSFSIMFTYYYDYYFISVSNRDLFNIDYLYFIGAAGKLPERFSGKYQETSGSKTNICDYNSSI